MANTSDGLPAAMVGAPQASPADRTGPPGRELGTETQSVGGIGGWASFLDEQERTPELTFPTSIETYHRMRTDSQIEALSLGTFQPIREYRWMIDPNKAPKQIVENAATDLGLPIKGEDPEDAGIKRAANKFDFDRFLSDALLGSLYGFMHFEIVGEVEEGKDWRMRKLAPRHPRTVEQFRTDEVGTLLGIKQRFGQNLASIPPEIPVNKLVSLVWRPEAGSHVGRSMLRSMFPEFAVKDRTLRIAVINLQRAGGVPVIEGPQGASDRQIEDLAQMARQFKVAEGGGGAIPFGSKLNLVGGNVPDAISLLNYCNEAMARVWALMLVQLGVTQGANRALGGEFAIYAARAQRLMAKWIVAAGNDFLDRYTEWNEPLADYAPLLAFEPSKPEGLSVTDLVALLDSGALTVDPELEEWLRSEFALPEKPEAPPEGEPGDLTPAEKALVLNSRNAPAPGAAPTYKQTPAPSRILDPTSTAPTIASGTRDIPRVVGGLRASLTLPDRKLRRDPTQGEIRAAVDFRALDTAHSQAVARLHSHYLGTVVPSQIKHLGNQVRAGVRPSALEAPVLGTEAVGAHLAEVAAGGAQAAIREAQVQGVDVGADRAATIIATAEARARAQAEHVATMNANGLSLGAQRRAGRLASTLRSRSAVASDLESHLTAQKHVFERENLRGATTLAQNTGRLGAMEELAPEQPDATYEASEILDDRTCGPCEAIDGTVYDTIEEAQADYASGGYVDCDGGPNCRGTAVAIYPEQNPQGGENRLREAEPAYTQPGEGEEPVPGQPDIPGVETPALTEAQALDLARSGPHTDDPSLTPETRDELAKGDARLTRDIFPQPGPTTGGYDGPRTHDPVRRLEQVPTSQLAPVQNKLIVRHLVDAILHPEQHTIIGTRLPNGVVMVEDGTHGAAAAILRGDATVPVEVADLSAEKVGAKSAVELFHEWEAAASRVEGPEQIFTTEHAASYIRDTLGYGDIPIEWGDYIGQALDAHVRPESQAGLDHEHATELVRGVARALGETRAKLGPIATNLDAVRVASTASKPMRPDALMATRYERDAAGHETLSLVINDGRSLEELASNSADSLSKATRDAYGVALHEMGHVVSFNTGTRGNTLHRIIADSGLSPAGPLLKSISVYATESVDEAWAESFATLMRPGAMQETLGVVLDDEMRERLARARLDLPPDDARLKGALEELRRQWNAAVPQVAIPDPQP